VNAIAPGFIVTEMTEDLPEKTRSELTGRIPLGRLGDPEDIAHAAVFLASEQAGYITGQVLGVNGGMYM
jgi:3-oxoacyl-[acyl-carrier protein] reductase